MLIIVNNISFIWSEDAEVIRMCLRVQEDLLKILELVRVYRVPIRDRRTSELVT
jgi:hypothetical protein